MSSARTVAHFLSSGTLGALIPMRPRTCAPTARTFKASVSFIATLLRGVGVVLGLGLGASAPAFGHEGRPLYLQIVETAPGLYEVNQKIPLSIARFEGPNITLPRGCEPRTAPTEFSTVDGLVRRAIYDCPRGLAGQFVRIAYSGPNPSLSTLIRFTSARGEKHVAILGPAENGWTVPDAETPGRVARQYATLGMEHIWTGTDHLLFLLCLIFVARTWQRILITTTGFTLAHSITLILSALDKVHLPIPPVEAAIALSIVFLAAEIARGPGRTLAWRFPVIVSSGFGLLHGFGFAAALTEIGLPQTEVTTGLLFFNVGVEIGQALFALAVIWILHCLRQLAARWADARTETITRTVTAYAVGTIAVYWLIERSTTF